MSKSREQLDDWLRVFNLEGKNIIDIGCQDKPISGRITHKNCTFKTLDIDSKWNPDYSLDISTPLNQHTKLHDRFDLAFAIEVLEHTPDLYQVLSNIRLLLRKRGAFVFSFPFINPLHDFFDFARYTPEGIKKVLEDLNFTDVKLYYRRATVGRDDLLNFYKKEGMRISKIRNDHNLIDLIGIMGLAKKG